jgi:hypothetical protein
MHLQGEKNILANIAIKRRVGLGWSETTPSVFPKEKYGWKNLQGFGTA